MNYDPHARGGSHWCAIVWSTGRPAAPGAVWWFDSFGLAPDADDDILKDRTRFRVYLEDIAAHHGVSFNFNRFDFQSLDTSVCGHYSALACVYGPPSAPMKGGADVWHRLAMLPQPARDAALPSLVRLVE